MALITVGWGQLDQMQSFKNVQVEQYKNQAAVLIAINARDDGDELLLTKRAAHLSLHSGEVAFPGGKWELGDVDLCETALRESHEEVGLKPSRVNVIDQLPMSLTRGGMKVTPYVGRIDCSGGLCANPGELESLFWIPVTFLLEDRRARTDVFELGGTEYWAPVYEWAGYTIWGFTARVLVEFLNRHYIAAGVDAGKGGSKIERAHSAPEIRHASG